MSANGTLLTVNCDFCGSDNYRTVCVRPDTLRVVECRRCGLAFLNPRPNADAIRAIYQRGYFSGDGNTGYADYAGLTSQRSRFTELDLLERYVALRGKRLVEVGCATGMLLKDARARGAEVVGVELSAEAADVAMTDLALDIRVGALEDVQDRLGVFDVAIACEVIEHVPEPTSFLRRLASIVLPNGYVLLTTPNYSCARRFGAAWFGFQTSFEHLYFLSDEVLARIAATVGLRELCWFTCGSGLAPGGKRIDPALKHLIRIVGLEKAARKLKAKLASRSNYEAYGHGHTLVALFQKTEKESPCLRMIETHETGVSA